MARKAGRGHSPRSARSKPARPAEVFFRDANTVYDAPLEVLWEFMHDGEIHGSAHHATLRNFEGKDLSPTCFEASYEVLRGGKWRKSRSRHTEYPPLCKVAEHLEGDYAGSVMLFQYWPDGQRTRVDVWARLRSDVLSARELRAHWRESFANAFKEDVAVLPRFLKFQHESSRRPSGSRGREKRTTLGTRGLEP